MKNVVVTIVGTQRDAEGEDSSIELVTVGHYYDKNGVQYITYKDSEISGLDGVTTMLKVYDQHVILVRSGSVQYKQEFRVGERHHSRYVTSYITMQMSVVTKNIKLALNSPTGNIDICYDLEINGQWQSTNTLSISVREEMKRGY